MCVRDSPGVGRWPTQWQGGRGCGPASDSHDLDLDLPADRLPDAVFELIHECACRRHSTCAAARTTNTSERAPRAADGGNKDGHFHHCAAGIGLRGRFRVTMCFVICYVRWHVGGGEGGRALELVEGPLEEFLARVLRRSDHDLGHLTLKKKHQSRLEN